MTNILLFCILFFLVLDNRAVGRAFTYMTDKYREARFRRRNHVSK